MQSIEPHCDEHADGIVEDRKKAPPAYFYILFYGLILWGVIFIAWFLFSGWSSHQEFAEKMAAHTGSPVAAQTTATAPSDDAPATKGALLYADNCAGCHGARGEGGFGPDLTTDSFKYGRSTDAVRTSIAEGRPKNMPAFGKRLSQEEIATLTAFVVNL